MAEDYYKALGVNRNATQAEIQAAHRKLARKYHPDLNPDDATARQKFQEVQTAFEVLNDPEKREMYDRYGASFESRGARGGADPRAGGTWSFHTGTGAPGGAQFEDFDFSQFFGERGGAQPSFSDIFGQFRSPRGEGGRRAPARGEDLQLQLEIPFNTAVLGGEAQVRIPRPGGKVDTANVRIVAGLEDGQKIRLRGQGNAGPRGAEPGDAIVVVRVAPHPHYTRRGRQLHVTVPVSLYEAAAGGKIDVPTPYGTVSLKVPPGSSSGTRLKVRGHGVRPMNEPPGDLVVELQVIVPKNLDREALEQLQALESRYPAPLRADLQW